MNISIFEVLGPVMIGPSSSHTAGAARLARLAAGIVGKPFNRVEFALSGSFARTYKGHGTDRALLAGVMGIREDDPRLAHAFELAARRGLGYAYLQEDIPDAPDNTVRITFFFDGEALGSILGASTGGGRIEIMEIDAMPVAFTAEAPTLVLRHRDMPGVLHSITEILSADRVNIAVMRVSRNERGGEAHTIIETDEPISGDVAGHIARLPSVLSARVINL